jgi:hypothetical protein
MINPTETQYINPRHLLKSQRQRYRHQYDIHPANLAIIDDFLNPELAVKCANFLQFEAVYKEVYSLYTKPSGIISKQVLLDASPSERFSLIRCLIVLNKAYRWEVMV